MKCLILSDIHGSPVQLEKVLDRFEKEGFDYLVLLGDILYHGPRNPVTAGYDPQKVVSLLNNYKDQIIACRGNCDAEVDQMLLHFPCMSDYSLLVDGNLSFFATHGHLYTANNFPKGPQKNVFLSGHTHLWLLEEKDGTVICNPGSITLPKENRPATYAVYESNTLSVIDCEGNTLKRLSL